MRLKGYLNAFVWAFALNDATCVQIAATCHSFSRSFQVLFSFLPPQKIEGPGIVTGGSPTLLASGRAEPEPLPNAAEAAAAAVAGRRLGGALSLTRYTWGDSTKTVK